jgi:glycosyltransferase involved in cell wall biosynthesis
MGQPTIVPNWPEFNLIIKHGENGFLYRTKEECADLTNLLINDYNLAKKLGAAGRETAEAIAGDDVRRKQWTEAFNLTLKKERTISVDINP